VSGRQRGLAALTIPMLAVAACAAGCVVRLSDPVFAFKDIRAKEPVETGDSLVVGTVVVDEVAAGDLDSVTFVKLGPGATRSYRGTNRVHLFRVFLRRSMRDGHFILEVPPGLYELECFTTSGWGQPIVWKPREDIRKHTRIIVTRPGIYDLGVLRVTRGNAFNSHAIERVPDANPARQAIFARAIAGTAWQRLAAGPAQPAAPAAAPAAGGPAVPPLAAPPLAVPPPQ
jgi:hypothetical protein